MYAGAAVGIAVGARGRRLARCCAGSRRSTADAPTARHDAAATGRRETLVAGVRAGDTRALARAISLVEDGDPLASELVRRAVPRDRTRARVGFTGPPGVGKSSLIVGARRATCARRADGRRGLGRPVEPVHPRRAARRPDPARPSTSSTPGSSSARWARAATLGGLAEATLQALLLLDAAGKDVVFLETVGTGQSEVGVLSIADTVVLVLMPGSGDSVQALKAGIMEIPDVIAINKLDHPLARTMANEVRQVLALGRPAPAAADRADRGAARRGHRRAVGARSRSIAPGSRPTGSSRSGARRNLAAEVFAVASARARRHLENAVAGDPELRGCSSRCGAGSSIR